MKIEVDTDKMPFKSKDGKDGKPGKRSIEVSFFDIFTPGRTIRQAKNRAQALKATNNSDVQGADNSDVQGAKNSIVQGANDSDVQGANDPDVQGAKNSDVQGAAPASGQDAAAPQAPGPAPAQTRAPTQSPATNAQTQTNPPAPATLAVEHPATVSNEDSSAVVPDPSSAANGPASNVESSPGWTADQDSRLTEMKNNNQSWKTISAAIDNKAVWELKKRWKEIGLGNDQGKNHNEGGKGKLEEKKAENKEKDAGFNISSTHDQCSISSKHDQAEPRYQRIYVIDPDFTVEEIEFLQHLYEKYTNHTSRCLAVASRFFDKTGRRITTGQVRDRFEGN